MPDYEVDTLPDDLKKWLCEIRLELAQKLEALERADLAREDEEAKRELDKIMRLENLCASVGRLENAVRTVPIESVRIRHEKDLLNFVAKWEDLLRNASNPHNRQLFTAFVVSVNGKRELGIDFLIEKDPLFTVPKEHLPDDSLWDEWEKTKLWLKNLIGQVLLSDDKDEREWAIAELALPRYNPDTDSLIERLEYLRLSRVLPAGRCRYCPTDKS